MSIYFIPKCEIRLCTNQPRRIRRFNTNGSIQSKKHRLLKHGENLKAVVNCFPTSIAVVLAILTAAVRSLSCAAGITAAVPGKSAGVGNPIIDGYERVYAFDYVLTTANDGRASVNIKNGTFNKSKNRSSLMHVLWSLQRCLPVESQGRARFVNVFLEPKVVASLVELSVSCECSMHRASYNVFNLAGLNV